MRPILDIVVDRKDAFKFPSKTPIQLANVLYNAFKIAEGAPDTSEYKKYAVIRERFRIKVKEDCVVFEPRERLDYSDPIIELAQARVEEMEFLEAITLLEIVGACTQHKLKKMTFPNARLKLGEEDFDRLGRWAVSNNYLITDTEPLTLSRKNDGNSKENIHVNES